MASPDLSEEQLRALYAWIDAIPLSRPKRNIARDFSDGVLLAEVVHAYFPALVEIHNYAPAHSVKQKIYNFETLNQRVLRKIGYIITRQTIEDVVNCKTGAVEGVLNTLQFKMAKYREKKAAQETDSSDLTPRKVVRSVGMEKSHQAEEKENMQQSRLAAQPNFKGPVMASVDEEILIEKERQIRELQETVEILELKIAKLEQLVRLKDNKIQKLMQR